MLKFLKAVSVATLLVTSVTPPPAHAKVKVETKLAFLPRYYFTEIGKGTNQVDAPFTLEPAIISKILPDLRLRFTPYVYADPVSKSVAENFLLDVNQANAEYRMEDTTIALGLNQVAWGVTDVFNPLDVVSARRYFDPLNSDKRAVPSLSVVHESGDWRWEGLYIPIQSPSILPGNNSRWLPRDVATFRQSSAGSAVLPSDLRFQYRDLNEIDGSLHHNFGGRIEVRKSGLDLSAILFQGAPTVPSIMPIITGTADFDENGQPVIQADADVGLQPVYYLRRTVGGSAVVTLDSSIIRFAVSSSDRVTRLNSVPGWSQSSVLGLEHNIPVAASTLTLLMQITYARHELRADNLVTSVDRIFDQSAMLGFRLATSNEWVFTMAGLYENVSQGSFVQAKAEKKIADGVSGSLQAEMIEGRTGTSLGSYSRNDRVGFGLSLFF